MAHIVTLKDHNDEISYPITPVDAVFVDSNTTLDDALDEKADTDLTNVDAGAVATAMIANGAVTADKIDWSTMPGSYSSNEIDTGYTWIDGNTIYKKTINFGALPNATTKSVAHGISNLDNIVKFEGFAKNGSGKFTPIPFVPSNSVALCDLSADATNISMQAADDRSGWSTCYVTLYYTKSS